MAQQRDADRRDTDPGRADAEAIDVIEGPDTPTAADALLRSLSARGVTYLFANLGTDHPPFLEALARARERDELDAMPEVVICPHEFPAMSAAHGYAVATGEPQAVLVHVDVGTQNLGAGVHNALRANAPVLVIAGRAPVSDRGFPGSRDSGVHYKQDVYDQPGIVRGYCRWTGEYVPPANPDAMATRALEVARDDPKGPVYLSAGREALESREYERDDRERRVRAADPPLANPEEVARLADLVADSHRALVVTASLDDAGRESLVSFAEAAGAGVVEANSTTLSFPRDHPLHLGTSAGEHLPQADLVLLAGVDIPWVPGAVEVPDVPVVQVDPFPAKSTFPHWDFPVEHTIRGAVGGTLAAVATVLDPDEAGDGDAWRGRAAAKREARAEEVLAHREDGRLTTRVLTDALADVLEEDCVVVEDAVTSGTAVREGLELSGDQRYFSKGGSGLGWAGGAAVGVKLAHPERQVVSVVGDGAYLFSHPVVSAWMAAQQNAPTLTVIYNNAGWNAVKSATDRAHPEGVSVSQGVPESRFAADVDLSAAVTAVDAHTAMVDDLTGLEPGLGAAAEAVAAGTPAVVDVKLEPI